MHNIQLVQQLSSAQTRQWFDNLRPWWIYPHLRSKCEWAAGHAAPGVGGVSVIVAGVKETAVA